jgi:hypothetical protein
MRSRALVVLVSCFLSFAFPVKAKGPGTYFSAESKGSPVTTAFGQWTESADGRQVTLTFDSAHVLGTGTRFVAGWLTPVTRKDSTPELEATIDWEAMNLVGDKIKMTYWFKWRPAGGKWRPWSKSSYDIDENSYVIVTGRMNAEYTGPRVQFDWKVVGEIVAPTVLRGTIDLNVN